MKHEIEMRTRPRGAQAGVGPLPASAPELERPFRVIAFDWDGTAVVSRTSDAARVARLIDALLSLGACIAIVTGTSFANVDRQLGPHVRPQNKRRLYLATNRGSEVFGHDRHGRPFVLWRRVATAEEERLLDAIVDETRARLERITGLPFRIVYDRLNRRKLDMIPEPRWADPPKSAIGELLGATEARLRGAGLRHGLREAFEMMQAIAADFGLAGARVTSDVKHVEIGLTDKSDAMAQLFAETVRPLRVSPSYVLIVGDEFGPIAGFEGSDARMLAVPEAKGAAIVSVGPEPGGAPEPVIHLGGGPSRFCELLEMQIALEEKLGPFAPPRDPTWSVEEPGFDVAREHEIESLLAIANGYVGCRASLAEGTAVSRPATFIAGAFEVSADVTRVPELVIAPDWGRIRLVVEGEPFAVDRGRILEHRRVLDLRRGVLLRECVGAVDAGYMTRLRTIHAASLADRHVLLEGVEITPLNFTGAIRVEAILSGEVKSASGASHWERFRPEVGPTCTTLVGETRRGLVVALTSTSRIRPASAIARLERTAGPTWSAERADLMVRIAEPSRLHRVVTMFTSRDAEEPRASAKARAAELAPLPPERVLRQHVDAWAERWRHANVDIDGAPKIDRALRFAAYHLIASANPEDPRTSIGARALAGEAYRGHVFWDTEIFMLPFFVHCWPEAARALLSYRHRTLDAARRKARALGYRGALYAWESADSGEETTPSVIVTPFGELVRVLSGEQEQHISADVAYAVHAYVRATEDHAFARGEGLEILVETARFWESRVSPGDDGKLHIRHVIGPDEYHEDVDDNAFTNWMARFNLEAAAGAVERYPSDAARLGVDPGEPAAWRAIAARIVTMKDPATGLIEQFAGFHSLELVDLAQFTPRTAPIDALLGRARTQRSQVVKQADVVELVALLWNDLTPEERRINFVHYEPRTAHGSSLSPGVHALVAAKLGLDATALRYFDQTADIDLGNTMGNAAGGVHAAALGSLWQAVVFGVAGVQPAPDDEDALLVAPRLLTGWRHVGLPFLWRGRALDIHVEPGSIEVGVEPGGKAPLPLRNAEEEGHRVLAEPGKRYASRLTRTGFGPWEEIRG